MARRLLRQFSSLGKSQSLEDKFKGCLVGGLLGDCFGKPYKLSDEVSKFQLQKYFDKLDGVYFKSPYKPYSSSTAFSSCIASSLIECNGFDVKDVSKRFVVEFFNNPYRDYGSNISQICVQLRASKFDDPFGPAKDRFLGMGSFGNGAAARVAPIVLFNYDDPEKMVEMTRNASNLTNPHKFGRDGAILQSWAIRNALDLDGNQRIDGHVFLDQLLDRMKEFEKDEEGLQLKDAFKYQEQLLLVKKLLNQKDTTEYDVINTLGHAKLAVYSVPTAIYCFLRALNSIPDVETSNPYRRTIQYAIALGGDADTIASMAGSIAGACFGYKQISEAMQKHCENTSVVLNLAESLYKIVK